MMSTTVEIDYTNWRGERRWRKIIPRGDLKFHTTKWHPENQWLFLARDEEDNTLKWFAMKNIHAWKPIGRQS